MLERIGGIVLCGGESKRMGSPKAWLSLNGELMLPRVVRLLKSVVSPVVVVAAIGQDLPQLPADIRIARDALQSQGPLQGLAAGLSALIGDADAAYVSSCDVPLLNPEFVRRMIENLGEFQICVPSVGGFPHPLSAMYRVEVLGEVQTLLVSGQRRMLDLFDALPTRFVGVEELRDIDPALESLRNVNTPGELAQVLRQLND